MPLYGLEDFLSYSPAHSSGYSDDRQQGNSLDDLLRDKLEALSQILLDIERSIRSRKRLSKAIVYRIYLHYCYLKSGLFELPEFQTRIPANQQSRLEEQLDRLKQERRKEAVECWRDIANLESEWRTWFKQYRDLKLRAKLLRQSK